MKQITVIVTIALAMAVFSGQPAEAADLEKDYLKSVSQYYDVSLDEVAEIDNLGIDTEELPVLFYIASKAEVLPKKLADERLDGDSWLKIAERYSLTPEAFYVVVFGAVDSKVYKPILSKFNDTPEAKWSEIDLTDSDIVNLVNLKMIYRLHDYSVYEIMAMRDFGKKFVRINNQVFMAKVEMNKKERLEAR